MLPLLVLQELRVALLRREARRQWLIAAWTAGGVTLFFMLLLGLASKRSSGRTLFHCLFALAISGVVTRGFALTADLFSEERRNGTLGLLVLTGLRPLEIFANKLLGAMLLTGYGLLGGLPFFAIPFLAGGVTATQFICALVFLANGLLFCVAVGLLASVVHRDGGQAQLTAQALAAALCGATPFLYWFSSVAAPMSPWSSAWLALSPAYPPYQVFMSFVGSSPQQFWWGSAITLGYSVAALILAALVLHCTWRERADVFGPAGWRVRWRKWMRGSRPWQYRLRARFLAGQPFCWLAVRDRSPVLVAYGILTMAATFWLAGWMVIGPRWLTPGKAFISSIVLHEALNLVAAYAAGRRFAEERLSGGFEILLTAPLRAGEIVEGQSKALLVQFRRIGLIVLLFDLGFCASGFATPNQNALGVAAYLFAWVLMLEFWFGRHLETASRAMWISAWTGRPGYAAMKAGGRSWWLLIWVWWFAHRGWGGLQGGHYELLFLGAMIVPIVLTFLHRHQVRQKLTKELRQIACAPIPARGDKRFKTWDPDKIFPPGRWGEMVLGPAKPRKPVGRMDTLNG